MFSLTSSFGLPRAVIDVAGETAVSFLSSLLPTDLNKLNEQAWVYSVLLTPQGKIKFDLFISRPDSHLLRIDVAALNQEEALSTLKRYSLRRGVNLTPRPDLTVIADLRESAPSNDPRSPHMGARHIVKTSDLEAQTSSGDLAFYRQKQMSLGLIDFSTDAAPESLYPHEANLAHLGVISFTKGCYMGQEVVARFEHRKLLKRRVLPFSAKHSQKVGGSLVDTDGQAVGEVLSSLENIFLAKIELSAQDKPLQIDGHEIKRLSPAAFDDTPSCVLETK